MTIADLPSVAAIEFLATPILYFGVGAYVPFWQKFRMIAVMSLPGRGNVE